jgi:CubicO group peptidase (beta-lactamase class C family)
MRTALALLALLGSAAALFAIARPAGAADWPVSPPAAQNLDPDRLARGLDRLQAMSGLRSVLVVRNGQIVAERGPTTRSTNIKSASKSLLSALVGIALERGELESLDQSIADLLPERAANLPDAKRRITLGNLMSMESGLKSTSGENYGAWVSTRDWARSALEQPTAGTPGETFAYSTGNSHLVAAILARATGEDLLAYARRHLLEPLDMDVTAWSRSPEGVRLGGNELSVSPRDLARLGQLYLQGGRWGERQIVPKAWVERSTSPHAVGWPDRYGAYGYLWWIPPGAERWAWFAAIGYGGQFLVVVPELEMLVVTTATLEGKGEAWDGRVFEILREDLFGAAR